MGTLEDYIMAALSPAVFVLSLIVLPFAASELKADVSQEAPKTAPQEPRHSRQASGRDIK